MQTKINTSTVVTLTLTIDEAKWLKDTMQIPMVPPEARLDDENPKDRKMREKFWHSISESWVMDHPKPVKPHTPTMGLNLNDAPF